MSQSVNSNENMYWNMIAATTQALSAAIAQVYSLEVRPADVSIEGSILANRVACNTQHLLKVESHIDKIIDPSNGSYYIENFTLLLAEKAWSLFTEKN